MKHPVLLVDYGGPQNLLEVHDYLKRLFNDPSILSLPSFIRRPVAAWIARKRLSKATQIYEQLGGASPINATVEKLCTQLNRKQETYEFIPAFLFQPPLLSDLLKRYPEALIFPLFPHYSKSTWGIINRLCQPFPKISCVSPYFDHALFMQLMYDRLSTQLNRYKDSSGIFIFCTAHAIPVGQVKRGDPYVEQLEKQVQLLEQKFPAIPVKLGYQSRLGPVRWTEPRIESVLDWAQTEGYHTAIVLPLSFTMDNSETLIELDKHFASLSKEKGLKTWNRLRCLNTDSDFQSFILQWVKEMLTSTKLVLETN